MTLDIVDLIKTDADRWNALGVVESLEIETAWIGAGFVRNLVWDHYHGQVSDCHAFDLDVLWFDPNQIHPDIDLELERQLQATAPSFDWSVKNQARMHVRNDDPPYRSVSHAMRHWPETATAIAARRRRGRCELLAPFGLDDLNNMILRPTSLRPNKLEAFEERLSQKDWLSKWPKAKIDYATES